MKLPKRHPNEYTQAGPYVLEEYDTARDLWRLRTADQLVIGPIFGRGTAELLAASPDMRKMLEEAAKLFKKYGMENGPKDNVYHRILKVLEQSKGKA